MKITTVLAPILAVVATVNAKALLAVFEDKVIEGQTYRVKWLNDRKAVRSHVILQFRRSKFTCI